MPDGYTQKATFAATAQTWNEDSDCGFCVLCYSDNSLIRLAALPSDGVIDSADCVVDVPTPPPSDSSMSGGEVSSDED